MPDPDYVTLRTKVEDFARAVSARRADQMRCRAGCEGCCHVQLSVCDVEADALREALAAMDEATRDALRARLAAPPSMKCVLLDDAGRCRAYEARPLVCRSQGLPLRYPPDTVSVDAVRATAGTGDVTWCPLNFEDGAPASEDVLDAERVDSMLALINRRVSDAPLRRTSLRTLVHDAMAR